MANIAKYFVRMKDVAMLAKDVVMVGRTGLHVKSLIVTEKYHVGGSKVRSDRGFWIESNFQLSQCYKNFLANF